MGKIRFGILNNKKIKNLGSYQSRKLTIQEISNPIYQRKNWNFRVDFPEEKMEMKKSALISGCSLSGSINFKD